MDGYWSSIKFSESHFVLATFMNSASNCGNLWVLFLKIWQPLLKNSKKILCTICTWFSFVTSEWKFIHPEKKGAILLNIHFKIELSSQQGWLLALYATEETTKRCITFDLVPHTFWGMLSGCFVGSALWIRLFVCLRRILSLLGLGVLLSAIFFSPFFGCFVLLMIGRFSSKAYMLVLDLGRKFWLGLDPMCEWNLKYYVCIWWMGMLYRSACIWLRNFTSSLGSF
jgi:hypothetical protein